MLRAVYSVRHLSQALMQSHYVYGDVGTLRQDASETADYRNASFLSRIAASCILDSFHPRESRRYASAGTRYSPVSVRPFVCLSQLHKSVFCRSG